jgi:hypothetical protein
VRERVRVREREQEGGGGGERERERGRGGGGERGGIRLPRGVVVCCGGGGGGGGGVWGGEGGSYPIASWCGSGGVFVCGGGCQLSLFIWLLTFLFRSTYYDDHQWLAGREKAQQRCRTVQSTPTLGC